MPEGAFTACGPTHNKVVETICHKLGRARFKPDWNLGTHNVYQRFGPLKRFSVMKQVP